MKLYIVALLVLSLILVSGAGGCTTNPTPSSICGDGICDVSEGPSICPADCDIANTTTPTNTTCTTNGNPCNVLAPLASQCCNGLLCQFGSCAPDVADTNTTTTTNTVITGNLTCTTTVVTTTNCDDLVSNQSLCVSSGQQCVATSPNGGCCSGLTCDASTNWTCSPPSQPQCVPDGQQCQAGYNLGCCSLSFTCDDSNNWTCSPSNSACTISGGQCISADVNSPPNYDDGCCSGLTCDTSGICSPTTCQPTLPCQGNQDCCGLTCLVTGQCQ